MIEPTKELCELDDMMHQLKDYGISCFEEGARRRIAAAWHDTADEYPPAGDEPYIAVLDIPGFGRKMEIWSGQSNHPFLTKWAYVKDLMEEDE